MEPIPYSRQTVDQSDVDAVIDALRSDFLTQGPRVEQFERQFAALHAVHEAVAVSNATAGLHIACLALGAGPGTRVWTSPNSFLASANCALYCGATIDFVDIDPVTRNMSVAALAEKLELAKRRGALPRIVIPVDFSGLPCDLREIRELADQYGFYVLEDGSHATGASYLDAPVGSRYAHATVFSFHAVKVLTTGEGGLVATQDPALGQSLRMLRSHGMTRDVTAMVEVPHGPWYYEQHGLGYNFRMTDIQAALGSSQLSRLHRMHERRVQLADRYDSLLADLPLRLPVRLPDRVSSWHLYVVEVDSSRTDVTRSALFAGLRDAGIGVNVHYIPIHTQPYYRQLGFDVGDFPVAEEYYSRAISIPLFPSMTDEQQVRVVAALRSCLER